MSLVRRPLLAIVIALLPSFLTACGGGGGGGGAAAIPVPVATQNNSPGTLSVTIGGPTATLQTRHAKYIPSSVTKVGVLLFPPGSSTINVTAAIAGTLIACPQSPLPAPPCTANVQVSPGSYTASIYTVGANGARLSQYDLPVTVSAGTTMPIRATLNGIIEKMNLSLAHPLTMSGSATTTQLVVAAYDFDNNLIVGPGNYYNGPINLTVTPTDADPSLSSAISFSSTVVNGPSDVITISYDGKSYQSIHVSAPLQFISTTNSTVSLLATPQIHASMYQVPSAQSTIAGPIVASDQSIWAPSGQSLVRIAPNGQVQEFCTNPGSPWLAPGSNGTVFFGLSQNYQPNPFAPIPCSATTAGLRKIDATGTITQLPFAQWTNSGNIVGPAVAPDQSLWVSAGVGNAQTSIEHFDASGNYLGSIPTSYNASGLGLGTVAQDGSFWYSWGPNILRCTNAGTCSLGTAVFGQPYIFGITRGSNNDMVITGTNNIYDVDSNQNVLSTISVPIGGNLCSSYAERNGGLWCGWPSSGSGQVTLMRYNIATHNYAFVQLDVADTTNSVTSPTGTVVAPDGRLWFSFGSSIGVAGPVP